MAGNAYDPVSIRAPININDIWLWNTEKHMYGYLSAHLLPWGLYQIYQFKVLS